MKTRNQHTLTPTCKTKAPVWSTPRTTETLPNNHQVDELRSYLMKQVGTDNQPRVFKVSHRVSSGSPGKPRTNVCWRDITRRKTRWHPGKCPKQLPDPTLCLKRRQQGVSTRSGARLRQPPARKKGSPNISLSWRRPWKNLIWLFKQWNNWTVGSKAWNKR